MDSKTKSIIIGLGSAFAAVIVIILLFFAISGIGGNNKVDVVSDNEQNNVVSNVVESDGNLVVPFDDSVPDDADDEDTSSSKKPVSSEEVSSEPEEEQEDPFGRSDIEKIQKNAEKFSEFVSAVDPVSYEWNTQNMGALSEVTVKLIADDGSYVVIGVPYESSDYTVDGENSGSGDNVKNWTVYKKSKSEACTLDEIVCFSNNMDFDLPRGVKIGTGYNNAVAAYLNLSTAEKTYLLYEYTDVLTGSAKIKSYKNSVPQAYTGGKIYKLSTYLNSFYKDNNEAYPFNGKCNSVIRYGYNSLGDTSESTGQWYMEYATKNYKVVGVRFYDASLRN